MIGPVQPPTLPPGLRGVQRRSVEQEIARLTQRAESGVLHLGGNRYPVPAPKRTRAASPIRQMFGSNWTGWATGLEAGHFTIAPAVQVYAPADLAWTELDARVVSFTIRNSINDAMGSARIGLFMGPAISTSLSPFVDISIYRDSEGRPLLDPGRRIFLSVAINNPGDPGAFTPVTIFGGRIDRVNAAAGGGLIELQCRDEGAFYQNVTVTPAKYGESPAGREASLVMGDIMTAHGFTPTDLLVLADPDWMVLEYAQAEVGVLDALRAIARQAGRDVRYFSSVAKLVYYTPNRTDMTSDLIVLPSRYEEIVQLETGDEDVRNYWDVYYETPDGVIHGPITAQDADSIARYGNGKPRRARINLTLTDNIRDDAAAGTFAAAALADTKEPYVSHAARAPLLPQIELNDVLYFSPNNIEYDNAQIVAVAEYVHEYANGHGMTTVSGRASRAAAYRAYRKYPPPALIASTAPPNDNDGMPDNTVHFQVDSLDFDAP